MVLPAPSQFIAHGGVGTRKQVSHPHQSITNLSISIGVEFKRVHNFIILT